PYVERTVYGLLAQSSAVITCAYAAVWISGIVFLRSTSLRLKEHGWLMMSAVLFYLFTPVEVYTSVLDYKMWYLDHVGSNDLVEFRKLFIHRLAALSGVPLIALCSYYTIMSSPFSGPCGKLLRRPNEYSLTFDRFPTVNVFRPGIILTL